MEIRNDSQPDQPEKLDEYYLFHAARADLLRRLDRPEEAKEAYSKALELTANEGAPVFLRQRIVELARTVAGLTFLLYQSASIIELTLRSSRILHQRHEAEVHVELHMAVKEGESRVVRNKIDFSTLTA
jgi:hypothetical protein